MATGKLHIKFIAQARLNRHIDRNDLKNWAFFAVNNSIFYGCDLQVNKSHFSRQ